MVVLCIDKSYSYDGEQWSRHTVSVLTPVATFSTKRKAETFVRKFEDDDDNPYVNWKYIVVSGNLPNNPVGVPRSVVNKIQRKKK